MFTVDIPELRGAMAKRGININELAKKIEVNRNTVSAYFKQPDKIPYSVINKISDALQLDVHEASVIFFTKKLT